MEGHRDAVGEVRGRGGGADRRRGAQTAHPVEIPDRRERDAFATEQGAAIHLADEEVEALLAGDSTAAEPVQRGPNRSRIPARVHVGGPRLAQVLQAVSRGMLDDMPEVERLVVRDEIVMEEHADRVVLDTAELLLQYPPVGRPFRLGACDQPQEPHRILAVCFRVVEHREPELHHVADEAAQMAAGQGVEIQVSDPLGREMAREDRHQRIAHRRRNPRVHAVRDDVVEFPEIRGEVENVTLLQLEVGESERGREPSPDRNRPGRELDAEKACIGKPAGHRDEVPARAASELQDSAAFNRCGIQAVQPCVGRDAIGVGVLPRAAGIVDALVKR